MTKIVVVEDVASLATVYRCFLEEEGYEVEPFDNGQSALDYLRVAAPTVVLLDNQLPDITGLSILNQAERESLPHGFIMMTEYGSIQIAIEALKAGACDFLEKPFSQERLTDAVSLQLNKLEFVADAAPETQDDCEKLVNLIASSPSMQLVFRTLEKIVGSREPIFISGEQGTGKSALADMLHSLESEKKRLFIIGHEDAETQLALIADDGLGEDVATLVLDNLDAWSLERQQQLSGQLAKGIFDQLRIIALVNQSPKRLIRDGVLYEDLYFRLNSQSLAIPALRHRLEDISLLSKFFCSKISRTRRLTTEEIKGLTQRSWPGNLNELKMAVSELVGPEDSVNHQNSQMRTFATERSSTDQIAEVSRAQIVDDDRTMAEIEREVIERAIKAANNNVHEAAKKLDIGVATIYRKLKLWNSQEAKD